MRLQREEKEGFQRKFVRAQREVERAEVVLLRARDEMAREEVLAASRLDLSNPHYLPRAQARIRELDSRVVHLRRVEERCRAEVLVSLRREKTYEKLIERRLREERRGIVRREEREAAQLGEAVRHNKAMRF